MRYRKTFAEAYREIYENAATEIQKQVAKGGMDKNMPVAVIQNGTTSKQKMVKGTISNIANKINIYGWDNYLERDIRDISIIQYISYIYLRYHF